MHAFSSKQVEEARFKQTELSDLKVIQRQDCRSDNCLPQPWSGTRIPQNVSRSSGKLSNGQRIRRDLLGAN